MRKQLLAFLTSLGGVAGELQKRRRLRQDWRTEEWQERFDSRSWGHITGEIPQVRAGT